MKNYMGMKALFTLAVLLISVTQSCREKPKEILGDTLEAEPRDTTDFTPIFDGISLNDWAGDPTYWRVENGTIIGEITPETTLRANTFLIYERDEPSDFELKAEFRISQTGNSGINYRSDPLDSIPYALQGYQADIDGKNAYTGQNYEERKRTTLAYRGEKVVVHGQNNANGTRSLRDNVSKNAWQSREILDSLGHRDSLKRRIKSNDWNGILLVIKGNRMQHYVNGVLMSEVIDKDTVNRKAYGKLGFQVHVGPAMKVEFRNIALRKL